MYKQKIVDAITGEETWKDFNEKEIEMMKSWEKELNEILEEKNAKKVARESALAKLAALGLTPEEIAAL